MAGHVQHSRMARLFLAGLSPPLAIPILQHQPNSVRLPLSGSLHANCIQWDRLDERKTRSRRPMLCPLEATTREKVSLHGCIVDTNTVHWHVFARCTYFTSLNCLSLLTRWCTDNDDCIVQPQFTSRTVYCVLFPRSYPILSHVLISRIATSKRKVCYSKSHWLPYAIQSKPCPPATV